MTDEESPRQKWEPVEDVERQQSSRGSVKETWNGLYLYLPDSLKSDFQLAYKSTSLAYQRESGSELPKMRAYYPLVVKLGMEAVEEMDAVELEAELAELRQEYTESTSQD
jgi:hypothetical protein